MTANAPEPARRTLIEHLSAGASALAGNVPNRVYLTLTNGSGVSNEDTAHQAQAAPSSTAATGTNRA